MGAAIKKGRPAKRQHALDEHPILKVISELAYSESTPALVIMVWGSVFLISIYQLWLLGAVPLWDADMAHVAFYSAVSDFTRAGRLLLWSPWTSSGTPLYLLPGTGSFSPWMQILSFLFGPGVEGYRLYWVTTWMFGGLGMLLLARHLGANWLLGTCLSWGFLLSGFNTGHAEHMDFVFSNSGMAWSVLFLDKLLLRPGWRAACATGLAWGLTLNGAYPGVGFAMVLMGVTWVGVRGITAYRNRTGLLWNRLAPLLVVSGLLTACIACPAYAAFLHESVGYSDRSGYLDKASVLNSNPLTVTAAITMASPYFSSLTLFGSSAFLPTDVSSTSIYFGLVAAFLLMLSVLAAPKNLVRNLFIVSAVFFFLMACSSQLPLRSWLYDLFPPSRYFRHSSIFRMQTIFLLLTAVAVSGKDVAKYIETKSKQVDWRAVRLVHVLGAVAFCGFFISLQGIAYRPPMLEEAIGHVIVVLAGLYVLVIKLPTIKPKHVYAYLLLLSAVDIFGTTYLSRSTLWTTDPQRVGAWEAVSNAHSSNLDLTRGAGMKRWFGTWRNDGLIAKAPELHSYCPLLNSYFEKLVRNPALAQLALGENRIWFAASAQISPETPAAHDRYEEEVQRQKRYPLLVHSGESEQTLDAPSAAAYLAPVPINLKAYDPERMSFEVDAPRDGWLLVTDRWSRSWKATVNAADTPVEKANFLWRAIRVKGGNNVIDFRYDTKWLDPFLRACWIAIAAGILGILVFTPRTAANR